MLSEKILTHTDFLFVSDRANAAIQDFAKALGVSVLDLPTASLDAIVDRLTQLGINARDKR